MRNAKKYIGRFYDALPDDNKRIGLQFIFIYIIIAIVALFMTVVNAFTGKKLLMIATLVFAFLSILDVLMSLRSQTGRRIASIFFSVEIIALFVFFIVSGAPEGFSAIWICLLPSSGLLLFQRKQGTMLCALVFVILIFFFRTPIGNSLLQYEYTESFKLRFPMLYLAFYAVSFFLETVRAVTHDALMATKKQYEFLYLHDSLTGALNRYGFNKHIGELLSVPTDREIALMMVDVDRFKDVNDRYGHIVGDDVLKKTVRILEEKLDGRGAVCRWGGEEFAVLVDKEPYSGDLAQSILSAIRECRFDADGESFGITVSIGVVVSKPNERISFIPFITQADACMYEAKERGRNQIVCRQFAGNE